MPWTHAIAVVSSGALAVACHERAAPRPQPEARAEPAAVASPAAAVDAGAQVPPVASPPTLDAGATPPTVDTCRACCKVDSDECDRGCARGEEGRGCLRRCGSLFVACKSRCYTDPRSCEDRRFPR